MLASITPLGERGRHSYWVVTVSAFALGASGAAAACGALAGFLGMALLGGSVSTHARLGLLAVAVLAAILLDASPGPIPGPRRQVNERWLGQYRGWVYGLGFGVQLGVGVSTVVSSAATYAALTAALLGADPGTGAVIMVCYGVVRGLTPLVTVRVRNPAALVALLRGVDRGRGTASRGAVVALAALCATALAGFVA
jgi:hypothetical protein